jgi:uncharacterized membrane protein
MSQITLQTSAGRPIVQPLRTGQCVILLAILALAAGVRFYHLTQSSLWMDEIWSMEISTGRGSLHDHLPVGVVQTHQIDLTNLAGAPPWWKIWTSMNGVTHPPLYHVVLRAWMDLFGNGPAATRVCSAIFSLGAVLVFFDVCRWLHGIRIALIAAAIMALSTGQVDFAQETRSYPMLIFLALCCADCIVRIEYLGPSLGRCIALTGFVVATALTHYFSAGVLIALTIYVCIQWRGKIRRRTLAALVAAGFLILVLWGVEFHRQIQTLPAARPDFLFSDDPNHTHRTLLHLIGLPTELLIGKASAARIPSVLILILGLGVLLVPICRLPWRRDLLLWVLWIFGTLGMLTASDLSRGSIFLEYLRYSILAGPAVYAILASIDWPSRPVLRDAAAFCTLALVAMFALQRFQNDVPTKEDWRQLATTLDSGAAGNDLLVFYGDDPWISPGMWYLGFKYYAPASQRPWLILHEPADGPLLAQLNSRNVIWLIGKHPADDAATILPGWRAIDDPADIQTTAGAVCRLARSANP